MLPAHWTTPVAILVLISLLKHRSGVCASKNCCGNIIVVSLCLTYSFIVFFFFSTVLLILVTILQQVVLVSNYTQTLDLFEKLCRLRRWVVQLNELSKIFQQCTLHVFCEDKPLTNQAQGPYWVILAWGHGSTVKREWCLKEKVVHKFLQQAFQFHPIG